MKQNHNYRHNSITCRLCRVEDKLGVILSDLNCLHKRMNGLQSQIDSRNELEMDLAINRLRLSAMSLKELADEESRRIKERYRV